LLGALFIVDFLIKPASMKAVVIILAAMLLSFAAYYIVGRREISKNGNKRWHFYLRASFDRQVRLCVKLSSFYAQSARAKLERE
jgi:hypothetical protein